MCTSKAPDTSAQDAENDRQRRLEDERQAQLLAQQQQIAEAERLAQQQRYDQMLAQQQAEAERQRQLLQQELDRQYGLQRNAESARQAEAAAARAAAEEKARQAREFAAGRIAKMDESRQAVESAYQGFDKKYFDTFAQDFVNTYKPQVDREYRKQNDATVNAFADRGTLRSSMSARSLGDLARGLNQKEAELSSSATDAAQSFQDNILSQKQDALDAINSAGAAATPVLADGSLDVGTGLTALQGQLGQLTTTAKNRAQRVTKPSIAGSFNTSFAGANRVPGVAAL